MACRNLRPRRASLRVDGGRGYLLLGIDQDFPDPTGEVAFEAAHRFLSRLPLGLLARQNSTAGWWQRPCVTATQ
jgi:hypothetical protein